MRSDPGLARLTVAGAGTALLLVAATAVPLATGAPRPTIPELLVIAGSEPRRAARDGGAQRAGGHLVAGRGAVDDDRPGHVHAGVTRTAGGAASAGAARARRRGLGHHADEPATGRGSGDPGGVGCCRRRHRVAVPVLALLGSALLATVVFARSSTPPGIRAATGALGAALVVVDPRVLGDALDPRMLATVVDLLLLGIAATATRQVTADPMTQFDVASGHDDRDEVGTWLARVLGVPRLQVAFPATTARWTRADTRRRTAGRRSACATSGVSSPT